MNGFIIAYLFAAFWIGVIRQILIYTDRSTLTKMSPEGEFMAALVWPVLLLGFMLKGGFELWHNTFDVDPIDHGFGSSKFPDEYELPEKFRSTWHEPTDGKKGGK